MLFSAEGKKDHSPFPCKIIGSKLLNLLSVPVYELPAVARGLFPAAGGKARAKNKHWWLAKLSSLTT